MVTLNPRDEQAMQWDLMREEAEAGKGRFAHRGQVRSEVEETGIRLSHLTILSTPLFPKSVLIDW